MSHGSGGAFYKEFPKTCEPDDFWGQVKRTVAGQPVSQDQIEMIVAAVRDGLQLAAEDFVLDICCGNGALSTYFFAACRGGLGVDFSECLIDIARRNFARRAEESYVLSDALEFARREPAPQRFTKALCYGSFQYLPAPAASELLELMHSRFTAMTRLFIGNLPDRSRLHDYYRADAYVPGIEDSADTMIGIWRSPQEFIDLAAAAGWQCTIVRMPEPFYAARYRYDAVLVREGCQR